MESLWPRRLSDSVDPDFSYLLVRDQATGHWHILDMKTQRRHCIHNQSDWRDIARANPGPGIGGNGEPCPTCRISLAPPLTIKGEDDSSPPPPLVPMDEEGEDTEPEPQRGVKRRRASFWEGIDPVRLSSLAHACRTQDYDDERLYGWLIDSILLPLELVSKERQPLEYPVPGDEGFMRRLMADDFQSACDLFLASVELARSGKEQRVLEGAPMTALDFMMEQGGPQSSSDAVGERIRRLDRVDELLQRAPLPLASDGVAPFFKEDGETHDVVVGGEEMLDWANGIIWAMRDQHLFRFHGQAIRGLTKNQDRTAYLNAEVIEGTAKNLWSALETLLVVGDWRKDKHEWILTSLPLLLRDLFEPSMARKGHSLMVPAVALDIGQLNVWLKAGYDPNDRGVLPIALHHVLMKRTRDTLGGLVRHVTTSYNITDAQPLEDWDVLPEPEKLTSATSTYNLLLAPSFLYRSTDDFNEILQSLIRSSDRLMENTVWDVLINGEPRKVVAVDQLDDRSMADTVSIFAMQRNRGILLSRDREYLILRRMRVRRSLNFVIDPLRMAYGSEVLAACSYGNFDYATELVGKADSGIESRSGYVNILLNWGFPNGGTSALGLAVAHRSEMGQGRDSPSDHNVLELMARLLRSGACPFAFFRPRGQLTWDYLEEWTGEEALASPGPHVIRLGGIMRILRDKIDEFERVVSVDVVRRAVNLAETQGELERVIERQNAILASAWTDIFDRE